MISYKMCLQIQAVLVSAANLPVLRVDFDSSCSTISITIVYDMVVCRSKSIYVHLSRFCSHQHYEILKTIYKQSD